MNTLLTWAPPNRQDGLELKSFTCTVERTRRRFAGRWERDHPAEWERLVQANIRKCNPPCQPPHYALLGRDDDGIGAFVFWEEADGPAAVEIRTLAVALRLRGKGGGWADEMMRVLFDTLTARAYEQGVDVIALRTWIHERNHGSQRLFRRYKLVHTGVCMKTDPALQQWVGHILVAGAEVETR